MSGVCDTWDAEVSVSNSNSGISGEHWSRNLSERPQSCVVGRDHDCGGGEWPMDSANLITE